MVSFSMIVGIHFCILLSLNLLFFVKILIFIFSEIPIFQVKDMDDVDVLEEKSLPISQVRKSFQRLSAVVKRQKIDNENGDLN